ncbi:MAG TPA: hypothetical protein VFV13_02310 [Acidimicrobiia bacterium]|nr:hypothetical protein [Acidimicrobiia bacterium]
MNHHGSQFSSNPTFVATLSAEASIISVGANSFGDPSATVLARWDAVGTVFQSQSPSDNALIGGNVTVRTNGVTSFRADAEGSGKSLVSPLD